MDHIVDRPIASWHLVVNINYCISKSVSYFEYFEDVHSSNYKGTG